jgi:hypothetical protein
MDNADKAFQEADDWRLSKLKDYGTEAYRPFVELLFKYQDAFVPYLRSLSRGIHSGGTALSVDQSTEVDRFVSRLFNDTANGLDELIRVLEGKDTKAITTFLKSISDKRPSLAFSTSYVAGLVIGRITKHVIAEKKLAKGTFSEDQSTPLQGQIH